MKKGGTQIRRCRLELRNFRDAWIHIHRTMTRFVFDFETPIENEVKENSFVPVLDYLPYDLRTNTTFYD